MAKTRTAKQETRGEFLDFVRAAAAPVLIENAGSKGVSKLLDEARRAIINFKTDETERKKEET